jgi:ABC-2 type transport system ATP-binding protein
VTVEAVGLGKSYGATRAVDQLSFELRPGIVTGFLGPNGAGKSTTLRLMLGLDRGDGSTLWDGKPLVEHEHVTRVVGAHLDAKFFHPSRSARNHLRMLATEASIPSSRVDEVIRLVGLEGVAKKRPSGFSLGMGQRLGLAGAILAQPRVLLLDEPANGLDPQSIQWLRDFLRHYASLGNAVFVSSHLLSEMQLMAEHLVVIAAGRMVADETLDAFVARSTRNDVLVRCTDRDRLLQALVAEGLVAVAEGEDGLAVTTPDTDHVGDVAFRAGIGVRELTRRTASLEEAFLELTSGDQQFKVGEAS